MHSSHCVHQYSYVAVKYVQPGVFLLFHIFEYTE